MKNAIIYVRVSTDEQADKGYSLQHQEERLRQYCKLQSINVVSFFKEDHSAKTFERPAFQQLLSFIKKNKGKANLLLFLKWDRFSRNAGDAYGMINQLNKLGVEPQAMEQPLDLNIPENKIMLAFYLAAPEVENDRRALNTIAGMRRAMKDGRYCTTAPKGYRNARDESNKPLIEPNEDAALVKWAFEEVSKGVHSVADIWRMVKNKGLNLAKSNIWYMFRNPIYCGKVFIPAYKNEEATTVEGLHQPIISEILFNNVQDVLSGKKRKIVSQITIKPELPLRGFLKCSKCGGHITGSASKGNGGMYFYYHCISPCKERFKAEDANESFYKELQSISANEQSINLFATVMKDYCKQMGKYKNTDDKQITDAIDKNKLRISNAQQLMVDGELSPTDYKEIKNRYEPEIDILANKQLQLKQQDSNLPNHVTNAVALLQNLPKYYTSASLPIKQKIIGSIYAEKLVFENNAYRTTNINEVVTLICLPTEGSKDSKKKLASILGSQSHSVTALGFKPKTF
jgi:site-specific DNA recombinase